MKKKTPLCHRSGVAAPSRGYREEMEHLAYCIRNREQGMESDRERLQPRCGGQQAMADAIVALTANAAMNDPRNKRIVFQDDWRQGTPRRSRASVQNRWMSVEWLTNSQRG